MKDKNNKVISIDAEKAFDKTQHLFSILKNSLNKLGVERIIVNLIKARCDRAKIILNSRKLKAFPLGSAIRQECPPSSLLFNIGSPSQSNWIGKRNKRHPNQKGRSKIVSAPDDMTLYIFYQRSTQINKRKLVKLQDLKPIF